MKCIKFVVSIFSTFLFMNSFSQNRNIVIADSADSSPLSYTTVKVINVNRGYYSDVNGIVKIPAYEKDSLMVEYAGHISRTFLVENQTDTIFLNRKEYELISVEVKSIKVKKKIGSFKYRKMSTIFLGASMEYGLKIDLSQINGSYRVQQLYLPLNINKKTLRDCVVKLHLYTEGKDGMPGEDILTKPVFITSDSFIKNDFYIDISNQKLIRSDKYLYLGVECIMDRITALYNANFSEKKAFNQQAKLSPISFYFSKEKQFFAGGYGHTFTRFLNSRSYRWDGNTFSTDPINFAGGLVVLCSQESSN